MRGEPMAESKRSPREAGRVSPVLLLAGVVVVGAVVALIVLGGGKQPKDQEGTRRKAAETPAEGPPTGEVVVEAPPPEPRDESGEPVALSPEMARERLGELADAFRESLRHQFGSPQQHELATRMIRILEQTPESASALAKRLDDPACEDREASVMIGVLGAVNTKEAEGVLRGFLADDRRPTVRRQMALISIGQLQEPGPEIDEVLLRLHGERSELSANALMRLGTVGGRFRESDPARYRRIRTHIEQALSDAKDVDSTRLALRAAANLGFEEVPQALRDAAGSDEPGVRATVAKALVRVGNREADTLLLNLGLEDGSASVRIAALNALLRRQREGWAPKDALERPMADVLEHVAASDPHSAVREWAGKQKIY
jgi:hypothetical protein